MLHLNIVRFDICGTSAMLKGDEYGEKREQRENLEKRKFLAKMQAADARLKLIFARKGHGPLQCDKLGCAPFPHS